MQQAGSLIIPQKPDKLGTAWRAPIDFCLADGTHLLIAIHRPWGWSERQRRHLPPIQSTEQQQSNFQDWPLGTCQEYVKSECRGKRTCCFMATVYDRWAAPVVAYHSQRCRQERARGGEVHAECKEWVKWEDDDTIGELFTYGLWFAVCFYWLFIDLN